MKRFFILVSMVALVVAGCTKTIIKNEVETPISFSAESGKLTRAIVDGSTVYPTSQPFGVYAFAHQTIDNNTTTTTPDFMVNVEIAYDEDTDPAAWRAAGNTKYYWPNDPRTTIDFYAYSPFIIAGQQTQDSEVAAHQKMTVAGLDQVDGGSLKFTNYTHSNMYVDFMVATPVKGATFGDPNGDKDYADADGKVPMLFHHQMTQIVFKVNTNVVYDGINFAVQSITLKNIKDNAAFTHTYSKEQAVQNPAEGQPNTETVYSDYGKWDQHTKTSGDGNPKGVYQIFPANETLYGEQSNTSNYDYVFATNKKYGDEGYVAADATGMIVTKSTTWTTDPVTMIPQNMETATTNPVAGQDSYAYETAGQMFEIVYSIKGTGVASEVVTKHVPFKANANTQALPWGVNQKITYNVVIGLNEITFEPSVDTWDDGGNQNFPFQQ